MTILEINNLIEIYYSYYEYYFLTLHKSCIIEKLMKKIINFGFSRVIIDINLMWALNVL